MNTPSTNGSERQTRGAVGNLSHFFCDLAELIELQGLLFLADARDEFRKARRGMLLIVVCVGIGVSCVPLGLAGAALLLAEETRLSLGQAFLCVAVCGMLLACVGVYAAARCTNPGATCLERSRNEWKCNVGWMKETLKHMGDGPHDPRATTTPRVSR